MKKQIRTIDETAAFRYNTITARADSQFKKAEAAYDSKGKQRDRMV